MVIKRFFRWLSCKFGNHYYSPEFMDFTLCDRRGGRGIYRVHTSCVFCGCSYDSIVAIQLPSSERTEDPEGGADG